MTKRDLVVRTEGATVVIGRPDVENRPEDLAKTPILNQLEQIEAISLRQQRLERLLVRIAEHLGIDP